MNARIPLFLLFAMSGLSASAKDAFEIDRFDTKAGELAITFIGHGSLMLEFGGKVIQVDPFSNLADYSQFPRADLVLITHEHGDHLDRKALDPVLTPDTQLVVTETVAKNLGAVAGKVTILHNGESATLLGLPIEAVPAYNIVHVRDNGQAFHPKGSGNGYIVTFGGKRVYIAADTENTPEMKRLRDIDIAFLPMNLPYTMTPEMVADAAKAFRPKILYPYHYGDTDTSRLIELMRGEKGIEVRIRKMS